LAHGDRNWSLNEGRIPNCRAVRVHVSTGYYRVEGNRRASRNGLVSDLPLKSLPSRIATFASLYQVWANDEQAENSAKALKPSLVCVNPTQKQLTAMPVTNKGVLGEAAVHDVKAMRKATGGEVKQLRAVAKVREGKLATKKSGAPKTRAVRAALLKG
jgi:hypothetical protein